MGFLTRTEVCRFNSGGGDAEEPPLRGYPSWPPIAGYPDDEYRHRYGRGGAPSCWMPSLTIFDLTFKIESAIG
jgi:hypothetical protein